MLPHEGARCGGSAGRAGACSAASSRPCGSAAAAVDSRCGPGCQYCKHGKRTAHCGLCTGSDHAGRARACRACVMTCACPLNSCSMHASDPEVQSRMTGAGQVEAALALASAVLQGGDLTSALQAVAAHLAKQATRMQLQQPAGVHAGLASLKRASRARFGSESRRTYVTAHFRSLVQYNADIVSVGGRCCYCCSLAAGGALHCRCRRPAARLAAAHRGAARGAGC